MFIGSCQESAVWKWMVLFVVQLLLTDAQSTEPELVRLPEERINELGCIPEGRNVSYQCTVVDPSSIGSTVWSGSAFQCPVSANQINLPHGQFSELEMMGSPSCGTLRTTSLNVNGSNYISQLSLTATPELNGTGISCSFGNLAKEDVITVGAIPPSPGLLMVTIFSESSLNVSWRRPPSSPVEGGVGMYEFSVAGEDCGCVSLNVSGDTTSVSCSGGTAAGQTCSFEVRTISQDCGFISDPSSIMFTVCDPAELGDHPSSMSSSGKAVTSNGVIEYDGVVVGSVANLTCNEGYTPGENSSIRTCMNNGKWSGMNQTCAFPHSQPIQDLGKVVGTTVGIILIIGTIIGMIVIVIFCLKGMRRRKKAYIKANESKKSITLETVSTNKHDNIIVSNGVKEPEVVSNGDNGPEGVRIIENGPGDVSNGGNGSEDLINSGNGPVGVSNSDNGPEGVSDNDEGPDGNFPLLSSAPDVILPGGTSGTPSEAAAAAVSKKKFWEGRQVLKVGFINPDDIDDWGWKWKGESLSVSTILAWSNMWSSTMVPMIPVFEHTERIDQADIRVKFSKHERNWSMVGMEATQVTDMKEPTMVLSLGSHAPEYQKSLVLHQFGHALGLEHEHQRSDFWDVLGDQLDTDQIKMDPFVNPAQTQEAGEEVFKKYCGAISRKQSVSRVQSVKYDPESIMHLWFNVKWIKNVTLQTYGNIDNSDLKEKTKEYLKGLHKRTNKKELLAKRPSSGDFEVLVKAYGGEFGKSDRLEQILMAEFKTKKE